MYINDSRQTKLLEGGDQRSLASERTPCIRSHSNQEMFTLSIIIVSSNSITYMNNGPQTKVIEGGDYMSAQIVGLSADTLYAFTLQSRNVHTFYNNRFFQQYHLHEQWSPDEGDRGGDYMSAQIVGLSADSMYTFTLQSTNVHTFYSNRFFQQYHLPEQWSPDEGDRGWRLHVGSGRWPHTRQHVYVHPPSYFPHGPKWHHPHNLGKNTATCK